MEKSIDNYLMHSNLHLFSPLEIGNFNLDGYLSSSKTGHRGGCPCGGKNYFRYHPDAVFNPYTGEIRTPDHFKKSSKSDSITPTKDIEKFYEFGKVNTTDQVQQNIYINPNGEEKQIEEMINPTILLLRYLSNIGEEVYKKNRVYDTNKIYEGLEELIKKLSLYKASKKSKNEKSTTKKKLKKTSRKEEIEELSEDEFNFNNEEIAFLWNLWFLLLLTNPQIDKKFEFLRGFLFVSNDLLKK